MAVPTIPATRVAYHRDGSAIVYWQDGITSPTTMSVAAMEKLNGVDGLAITNPNPTNSENEFFLVCVFAEPRNLRGVFASGTVMQSYTVSVWTSVDTTDGVDGTWVDSGVTFSANNGVNTEALYLQGIVPVSVDGVKGVRLRSWQPNYSTSTRYINAFHVYADTPSSSVSDRIQFWHPTLDQPLSQDEAVLDPLGRGSSSPVKSFRLKNVSPTLTAAPIDLSFETLNDTSPSLTSVMELSDDDVTYGTTVQVASLGPLALSPVLYYRFSPTALFPLGIVEAYIKPVVGAWT